MSFSASPDSAKRTRWQHHRQQPCGRLPSPVASWLLDRGSLTERLIEASNNQFRVEVQRQGWFKPRLDEARILGLATDQVALIRETLLICQDQPWVFARSVIPAQSVSHRLRFLRKLRNQSLGALLFKDAGLTRSHFQIVHGHGPSLGIPETILNEPHPTTLPATKASQQSVWGRRSVFHLYRQPLLVAELFLPAWSDYLSEYQGKHPGQP